MLAFTTPRDTKFPTTAAAVAHLAERYKPLTPFLSNRDSFLRQVRVLRQLADAVWQAHGHLRWIAKEKNQEASLNKYADDLGEEWKSFVQAAYADADDRGVSRDEFMNPYGRNMLPYRGADQDPDAFTSISRLIDGNFHTDGTPSIFLMRQLASRLVLKGYTSNISTQVKSKFFDLVRAMPLADEWHEAQELIWAAALHDSSKVEVTHHRFGYCMLREFKLIGDLFELVLRQLQDPLK